MAVSDHDTLITIKGTVETDHNWIENYGKPAIEWVSNFRSQLSLLKFLLGLIAGSQLITIIVLLQKK